MGLTGAWIRCSWSATLRTTSGRSIRRDSRSTPRAGLFVFDRGGRWLLRVEPDAQGSFASAAVTSVDLSRLDLSDPRGLAFDQTSHLHLLTGTNWTLSELTEEGELVATRDLSGIGLFDPRAMVSPRAGT